MTWEDDNSDDVSDDDATAACPHCGELIYDDTERCPECGRYVSREDSPPERKPRWVLIGVAICLAIVLAWIFLGM